MELLRYVTASPIPTMSHIYHSHSKGPGQLQAVQVKLSHVDKYLRRLEKLKHKARRTNDVYTLAAIRTKAERISRKLYSTHLHGRVKRHVHKKIQRAQEEISALLEDAIDSKESDSTSDQSNESDGVESSEPSSSDTEVKYHITLEDIPDEDGI